MSDGQIRRHLVLVGLMGAGKTTVGERCAQRLRRPFVDVDDVVEATTGQSVATIFETMGDAGFRDLERHAVADVCASPDPLVIACGGGAVVDPENRRVLRANGFVVWLRATPGELARRVSGPDETQRRPLLVGGSSLAVLERLAEVRASAYESASHVTVETDGRDVDDVAAAVLEELSRCTA